MINDIQMRNAEDIHETYLERLNDAAIMAFESYDANSKAFESAWSEREALTFEDVKHLACPWITVIRKHGVLAYNFMCHKAMYITKERTADGGNKAYIKITPSNYLAIERQLAGKAKLTPLN